MIAASILLFLVCCLAIYLAGGLVIDALSRIAKFLGWKEFVVAFMVMAFAGSLPNLFLGIISVIDGVPELSFGDVVGGNVVDLTLVVALATFFAKDGIPARSRVVQTSSIFTVAAVILPLALFMDGNLSRIDGAILIGFFFYYLFWLFSKKERFSKIYNHYDVPSRLKLRVFLTDIGKIIIGTSVILAVTQGIVLSANALAKDLNIPLAMVGILILGLGNSLPEMYFSIASARKGETRMILGDLMGAVIIPATLVLGFVALASPINISDFSLFVMARYFCLVAALFFFIFVRTDRKLTKKEAAFLLVIYVVFMIVEIFVK
jgi:cation:H+ antiporter